MKVMIIGPMASGKTITANYIQLLLEDCKSIKLAEPLYHLCENLDVFPSDILIAEHITPFYQLTLEQRGIFSKILNTARKLPNEKPKPRKRLQYIGTDGARKLIADDIWIKIADRKSKFAKNCVIDDIRFINEYEYFFNKGWLPIYLEVSKEIQIERLNSLYPGFDPESLNHASEVEIREIQVSPESRFDATLPLNTMLQQIQVYINEKNRN